MSERNVTLELQSLAALANVTVDDIQHFVAGITGPGAIEFDVPGDHCAVVVAIEQFNVDDSAPNSANRKTGGETVTEDQQASWTTGGDVFYVYPGGRKATITLNATPQGGKVYTARAVGYFVPHSAYARLARMGTRILS